SVILTDGTTTIAGILSANGGSGGMGGFSDGGSGGGGAGGNGGSITFSGGNAMHSGSLIAQGGMGGHSGFSAAGTGNQGGGGGNGGQLLVSGGTLTSSGIVDLRGGNGGERNGDGGNGGNLSITAGEFVLQSGSVDLRAGAGNMSGADGTDGALSLDGGTLAVDALGPQALENLLVGGQFLFNSGTLRITDDNGFVVGSSGLIGGLLGTSLNLTSTYTIAVDDRLLLPTGTSLSLDGALLATGKTVLDSFVPVTSANNSQIVGPVLALTGSTIDVVSGTLSLGDATDLSGVNLQGTLNVGGNSATLNSAGYAQLGELTTLNGGMITAANGIVLGSGDVLTGNGSVNAPVAAGIGSTIQATSLLTLGDSSSVIGFASEGVLHVGSSQVTIQDANLAALGALTTLGTPGFGGVLNVANGAILDFADNLTGEGTVVSPNDSTKPIINNGSVVGTGPGQEIIFDGYVKGFGTFTDVVFNGTYAPGLSPAEVNIGGDMTLGSSATLEIELAGTSPGSGHDKINVAGTANLNGALDVLLIGGFENSISASDQFTVLDAGALTGVFTNVAPGGRLLIEEFNADIQVDYGATSPFNPNQVVLSDINFIPFVATWTGGTSNWTTATNWDINQVPNNGPPLYDAIVPAGTTIVDAPIEVRALTVGTGGGVQVDNDLTVTDTTLLDASAVVVSAGATLQLGGNVTFMAGGSTSGPGTISPDDATILFDGGAQAVSVGRFNLGTAAHTIIGRNSPVTFVVGQIDDDNTIKGVITLERGGTLNIGQTANAFWQTSAESTLNFENSTPETSQNQIAGPRVIVQGTMNVNGGLVRMRADTTLRSDPNYSGQGVARATVNMNPEGILRFDNDADIEDALITGGGTVRVRQESVKVATFGANVDMDIDLFETELGGTAFVNGSNIRVDTVALDSGSLTLDAAAQFEVSDVGATPGVGFFVGSAAGAGTVTIDGGATLNSVNATILSGGEVAVSNGVWNSTNAIAITGGQLRGAGAVVADIDNSGGTVAPGLSPGILSETGNYTQGAGGTLAIELGGTTLGAEYDQLAITGSAVLDGVLDVSLVDLGGGVFEPIAGDTFSILTATGGISGTFTSVNLPALAGDLLWYVNYGATSVELVSTYGADFDENGDVDTDDLIAWEGGFGGPAIHMSGDSDNSTLADGFDFLTWQRQFGNGVGAPLATVDTTPEPSSLALLLLGLGLTGLCKQRD
ncbi:MAG: PEP-CTERM sorting domain-containing protein, partial [Planctomycetales bacterium]|nr:PEP-CTERM sorting domain-containing protein [Planctomycetales bacterium]